MMACPCSVRTGACSKKLWIVLVPISKFYFFLLWSADLLILSSPEKFEFKCARDLLGSSAFGITFQAVLDHEWEVFQGPLCTEKIMLLNSSFFSPCFLFPRLVVFGFSSLCSPFSSFQWSPHSLSCLLSY